MISTVRRLEFSLPVEVVVFFSLCLLLLEGGEEGEEVGHVGHQQSLLLAPQNHRQPGVVGQTLSRVECVDVVLYI